PPDAAVRRGRRTGATGSRHRAQTAGRGPHRTRAGAARAPAATAGTAAAPGAAHGRRRAGKGARRLAVAALVGQDLNLVLFRLLPGLPGGRGGGAAEDFILADAIV